MFNGFPRFTSSRRALRRALGCCGVLGLAFMTASSATALADEAWSAPHAGNPILPGYFADPSIVTHEGRFYLYATLDPWGGETLGCWESDDFKNWTYRVLNWPTKAACTSPTSKDAKVWAPSVIHARNGKFYLYVSVGSEIWAGVAEHPLGPWRNALGDRPLIPGDFRPGYHMIDAEAFIDDDGAAYLYWGSGWNWTNGRCWAVKLQPDMVTFDGEVRDVTPESYFEAPFMVKSGGRYYLTSSIGKTIEDTYAVAAAVGDTPFGPFHDVSNNPILATDATARVISPGHHAVFRREGRTYILYHRHSIPFDPAFVGRQVCVDELRFTADGYIDNVTPTHAGPAFVRGRLAGRENLAASAVATASSVRSAVTSPAACLDDNYATLWAAAEADARPWLQLDLGEPRAVARQELRFEYAWKPYAFVVESSLDGRTWTPLADYTESPASGSPVVLERAVRARYLRLAFARGTDDAARPALFEWVVQP
ncbi:MAG TPA: family 43 glycosylhydrolase [Opitutus sp.]|nr:family 43 glycosylhydrolase [Opitutus sp.]